MICLALLYLALASADKVNVSIFGESGCPDTIGFIFGPLAAAEKALFGAISVLFRSKPRA